MGSLFYENGGDEFRVLKFVIVFLGDLSLSGEGFGFCGYFGFIYVNIVNYDLGFYKEYYLY